MRTRVCRAALRFPAAGRDVDFGGHAQRHGYGLKGTSSLLFRDKACATRPTSTCSTGRWEVLLPGMEGSRSDGLLASAWASLVATGRAGYRAHAQKIFATCAAMVDVVREHPQLRLLGQPDLRLRLHLG